MTPKQTRFVSEYRKDLNATQAAIRAGYSPKVANREGTRLLSNAVIAAAVAQKTGQQLEKADLTAERVLEEMRRCAFADPRSLFDAAGNLRPIHELTAEEAACIGSFEVIKKNAEAGDGIMDTVHKVKILDKTRTLEMLGKHFALLTERVHHTADDVLVEALKGGRKRASNRE